MKHPPLKEQLFYILSSSELVIFYLILFYTCYSRNLYSLILLAIIILKTVFIKPIKTLTGKYTNFGKRPKLAMNCNMMNCGGKPIGGGFPSGHMVVLGLLIIIVLNSVNRLKEEQYNIYVIYGILIISTAIGRYYTNCHTILQIVFGYFIGLLVGIALYYIDDYGTKNFNLLNEHKEKFYKDFNNIIKYDMIEIK